MAVKIKYNGDIIASLGVGQTITLKCAGMKMLSDVVVEVDEQEGVDQPSIAAGLYETGTNYGTMIASWDELVESGQIMIEDGAVISGYNIGCFIAPPSEIPAVNEYGFYYGVPYSGVGNSFVFHDDGAVDNYYNGQFQWSAPAHSAVYSSNYIDLSFLGMGAIGATFSDEKTCTMFDTKYSLGAVVVHSGDLVFPSDGSVTAIGIEAFRGCNNLTGAKISSSVTSIANAAFYLCTNLDSVGTVGSGASVELPDTMRDVTENLFGECYGLTRVELPYGVETIAWSAFGLCTELTDVVIPNSVTFIDGVAFSDCTALTHVTVLAENPPTLGTGVFKNCPLTEIKVPASSVDAYKAADGWSEYADIIVAI